MAVCGAVFESPILLFVLGKLAFRATRCARHAAQWNSQQRLFVSSAVQARQYIITTYIPTHGTGLTDFKFLVVARPVVGLFFGGAGIHSLFCATIAAVCWMACLKRERQLQMKRNRRRTSAGESIDSALATVSTGVVQEQHQQQLRHRANQAVHPTE
jgi:hypothetical protein